jgi:hypothetical protein
MKKAAKYKDPRLNTLMGQPEEIVRVRSPQSKKGLTDIYSHWQALNQNGLKCPESEAEYLVNARPHRPLQLQQRTLRFPL